MNQANSEDILIVEDEPLIRMMAADALADCGFVALEAENSEEALRLLDAHPDIGILFTDVAIPGKLNGLELAKVVHARHPDIGLIVTSGTVALPDSSLPDHGTFLPKPYVAVQLTSLVAKKLGR